MFVLLTYIKSFFNKIIAISPDFYNDVAKILICTKYILTYMNSRIYESTVFPHNTGTGLKFLFTNYYYLINKHNSRHYATNVVTEY